MKMKMKLKLKLKLFFYLVLVLGMRSTFLAARVLPDSATLERRIDSLMSLMTLEEKVAMCHAQSKFSSRGAERLGIPELWMSDGPHGVRAEIMWDSWKYAGWTNDSVTAFPALTCLAATFHPALAYAYGHSVGEEARYRKKDVLLGPGVNIYRHPLNGRNFEYMGEDPFLASRMVVPYVQGVQENHVAACVKHFALNNQELWRGHIDVEVSERALREIYLPAFRAAVREGHVWTVMGAYNKFQGEYCCQNPYLLNEILKDEWGFDGVVISDWGAVHETRGAALGGLDLEMGTGLEGPGKTPKNYYDHYHLARPFLRAIRTGEIDTAVVDDKVRRILRLMMRTTMSGDRPTGRKNNAGHHHVALQVACEGIVLLKNDRHLLPVDDREEQTILVVGENARKKMTIGGGSSELKAQFEISPLAGLKTHYKKSRILYARGYSSHPARKGETDSLRTTAVAMARDADVVLFIGGLNKDRHQDCEGGDRLRYGLPYGQDSLIMDLAEANPRTAVLIISGNAVAMPWLEHVPSVMQVWYLGSMAGEAIAQVVSGKVNPSGKLPFSFPKKLKDNSAMFYGKISYPGDGNKVSYREGILVGYRWFDTRKIQPLFAFGHGLSYTSFNIGKVTTDKKSYRENDTIRVFCEITNTGRYDGAEVIQVYVGKNRSAVPRAVKELKGFRKVFLKKGESLEVTVPVTVHDLAYYDEPDHQWKIEKGDYILYIGNASDRIAEKLKVRIK